MECIHGKGGGGHPLIILIKNDRGKKSHSHYQPTKRPGTRPRKREEGEVPSPACINQGRQHIKKLKTEDKGETHRNLNHPKGLSNQGAGGRLRNRPRIRASSKAALTEMEAPVAS